jgi:hypothetical protein
MFSRRNILKTLGIAAGASAVTSVFGSPLWFVRRIEAASLTADDLRLRAAVTDEFKAMADVAFDEARKLGCSYADIEINRGRLWICMPGDDANQASAVIQSESSYFDVRAFHSGAWGLAVSQKFVLESLRFKQAEAARVTVRAVATAQANAQMTESPAVFIPAHDWEDSWVTPQLNDQLVELIQDRLSRISYENDAPGRLNPISKLTFRTEEKFFASTKNSCERTSSVSIA